MTPEFIEAQLRRTSGPFRALCLLLAAAFLMGGGARGDIQSLVVLRPVSIGLLFYGLARLDRTHVATNRGLLLMALAIVILPLLHLVPLPPSVWSVLPGRDLVVEIDRAVEAKDLWRPLSMAPDATLNAFYASLIPCGALVLGVQLEPRERWLLLWPVLMLGGLSAAVAIAQISGPTDSPLYLYRVTNDGKAVGLFANRNHQALLLAALLPVLGVWAAGDLGPGRDRGEGGSRFRSLLALFAGAALVLLVLVTGSRAGLVLAFCALAALPIVLPGSVAKLFDHSGAGTPLRSRRWLVFAGMAAAIAMLVALTLWRGRGLALERMLETTAGEDMRFQILPALMAMIRLYLLLGSGMGSFERVFQIHEPDGLLRPTYANHVHNDWLEVALTGGIPAVLLLIAAGWMFLARARILFARGLAATGSLRLARLGMIVILLSALASLGDYPLRVPSLSIFFVVAALWMSCPLPEKPPSEFPS